MEAAEALPAVLCLEVVAFAVMRPPWLAAIS